MGQPVPDGPEAQAGQDSPRQPPARPASGAGTGVLELALFDLDGTLTRSDTLLGFVLHACGLGRTLLGGALLSPALLLRYLGLHDNDRAKEKVLAHFFGGWSRERLEAAGRSFAEGPLRQALRPAGLAQLRRHLELGHETVLVTASAEEWVAPFAQSMGLRCIATKLAYDGAGRFAGRFVGRNCRGPEKVRRLREVYDLEGFARIRAYGDSRADAPMLELAAAEDRHWKPFR